ncbi:carbonic anhydrase [Nocardioides perillae]|uniref:carbonic anhydrase n=1 Tax=Nocardioides perillae TaxID=1119534 RepID=A0A7Y9RW66_9ACTN|nr:carbonic anhydrase [Nocardioides perillae]
MSDFDDLLEANARFAEDHDGSDLRGAARAGVALVTCMDSRIDPLRMLGLELGDVKVVRNPGGRVTPEAMEALVLAAHLLEATRIMVVPHTKCAVATNPEAAIREKLAASAGTDVSWQRLPVTADQRASLEADVAAVRSHPLIPDSVTVGGFLYDVDSGRLEQLV